VDTSDLTELLDEAKRVRAALDETLAACGRAQPSIRQAEERAIELFEEARDLRAATGHVPATLQTELGNAIEKVTAERQQVYPPWHAAEQEWALVWEQLTAAFGEVGVQHILGGLLMGKSGAEIMASTKTQPTHGFVTLDNPDLLK
jgi:hypothetical protein